nr:hypothetical protein SFGR64A_00112 [Sinorhizobium fredii GR64]
MLLAPHYAREGMCRPPEDRYVLAVFRGFFLRSGALFEGRGNIYPPTA